jgi:hypothetical protein
MPVPRPRLKGKKKKKLPYAAAPWNPKYQDKKPKEDLGDKLVLLAQTPEGRAALLKQVDAELARAEFPEFCKQAWAVVEPATRLQWNWHHQLICEVLQALFEDWLKTKEDPDYINTVRNTVFNLPPGSLKSRLIAVFFMAWCWLRAPGMKFICLSVNEDAAHRDARACRDLIKSDWYQSTFKPEWKLKGDQDAISNYGNTSGGERLSKPSGSEVVGLRSDVLLIDDANNPHESENALERNRVNSLWETNTYNRVNDPLRSLRIGVQQRTNAEDWTGYVLLKQGVWSKENPERLAPRRYPRRVRARAPVRHAVPARAASQEQARSQAPRPRRSSERGRGLRTSRAVLEGVPRSRTSSAGKAPATTPVRCSSVRRCSRVRASSATTSTGADLIRAFEMSSMVVELKRPRPAHCDSARRVPTHQGQVPFARAIGTSTGWSSPSTVP